MKRHHLRTTFEQRESIRARIYRDGDDVTPSELDLVDVYDEYDADVRQRLYFDELSSVSCAGAAIVLIIVLLVVLYNTVPCQH